MSVLTLYSAVSLTHLRACDGTIENPSLKRVATII